jgi:hypothetical protein
MAYEDEGSSQSASSNWAKNRETDDFDEFFKKDKTVYEQRIIDTLEYLADIPSSFKHVIRAGANNVKGITSPFVYAIDGSNNPFESTNEYGHAIKVGLSIGAAFLDINDLAKPEINRFGTANPSYYAKLYGHSNNLFLSGLLPAKNIFFSESDGTLWSQKKSYLMALNRMLSKDGLPRRVFQHTMEEFHQIDDFIVCDKPAQICELKDVNKITSCLSRGYCDVCKKIPIEAVQPVINLTRDIQNDVIHHQALNESQELMLVLENILATYIIKQMNHHKDLLIVLDGRLENNNIGETINQWLKKNHNKNITLIGVQKSGVLNKYLSDVHQILKTYPVTKSSHLNNIIQGLKHNNFEDALLIILDDTAKKKLGIPHDNNRGKYGTECLYLSSGNDKKEFVFTIPSYIIQKYSNEMNNRLARVLGTIENTHTNLYLKSHGALLPNILAHDNVSLNRKLTNRVEETKDKQMNLHQSGKKPKA